jgi:hypothetical protein
MPWPRCRRIQRNLERKILSLRGERVMLDADLAVLYGVPTKQLVRAVQRNAVRFPADFMFQLTEEEDDNLRCQFGTSRSGHGGRRTRPYVFTEQGVAMLSGVLHSRRAVVVNVEIMRAFVRLRSMLVGHADLAGGHRGLRGELMAESGRIPPTVSRSRAA